MTDITTRQLRCPSCDGAMQAVDRRGVLVDICRECRGVFLDRGELDKLLDDAAQAAPASPFAEEADRLGRRDRDDEPRREWDDDHGGHDRGRGGRRRRRGFLDDIFDFD